MKRIVAGLIGLSLFLAGCGVSRTSDDVIGVVALTADFGDVQREVTHATLDAVVGPTAASQEFVDLVYGGSVPPDFEVGVLTEHLVLEAIEAEVESLGGEVTEADVEASKTSLLLQVEQLFVEGDPVAEAERLYGEVPYLPFLARYQAAQDVLTSTVADSADSSSGAGGGLPCVRHILVDTEAEGDDILTRLDGGEDFSALAAELSTGPSGPDGGNLGCADPAGYVPEFAAAVVGAEVGEYVGPVMTQFGWHVLVVDRYEVDARTMAGDRVRDRLGEASIVVDEELGTWDATQLTIVPTLVGEVGP